MLYRKAKEIKKNMPLFGRQINMLSIFTRYREDARVAGRSLGGPRRSAPGGGGLGGTEPECREPPGTLSQRYKH